MDGATIAQTVLTLILLLVFLGFLVWGIRTGQFRNVEEPKYRMLENDEDLPEDQKEKGDSA
ncbi:MAG TPA: cbb3-type cytochrome oxidase assembly protein [Syntrophales bacterium]|nr:cbb3-type cytochrome oxidase assembly protein [Syntrophales bacterium]HPQ44683.1 cbb3-type cytochrome oxidase assembly protein [Syntrophales bacterium]